jgi:2-enoate reductase
MEAALQHMKYMLGKTHAKVILNKAPSKEEILSHNPEAVIVAIGSRPLLPNVAGIDLASVYNVRMVYEGAVDPEGNVVIVGGGDIGCETADLLTEKGIALLLLKRRRAAHRMKEIPNRNCSKTRPRMSLSLQAQR